MRTRTHQTRTRTHHPLAHTCTHQARTHMHAPDAHVHTRTHWHTHVHAHARVLAHAPDTHVCTHMHARTRTGTRHTSALMHTCTHMRVRTRTMHSRGHTAHTLSPSLCTSPRGPTGAPLKSTVKCRDGDGDGDGDGVGGPGTRREDLGTQARRTSRYPSPHEGHSTPGVTVRRAGCSEGTAPQGEEHKVQDGTRLAGIYLPLWPQRPSTGGNPGGEDHLCPERPGA